MGVMHQSPEYQSFRSSIPLRRVNVDGINDNTWGIYDAGPKHIRCPLIFLPPLSGHADVYFRLILSLSNAGYRVISVEYPSYWAHNDWCLGFSKLLDHLQIKKAHIFGSSFGGFLAQKFAEYSHRIGTVASLVLCNSFTDTTIFERTNFAKLYWMLPSLYLKQTVMKGFEQKLVDTDIADSIDFMVESLDSMKQKNLASRLTMSCMNSYIEPQLLRNIPITLIDVNDENALSDSHLDSMYKCYPDAKKARLKDGGNFPYLSRSDEVIIHIQIHLRQFWGTNISAMNSEQEIMLQSCSADSSHTNNLI